MGQEGLGAQRPAPAASDGAAGSDGQTPGETRLGDVSTPVAAEGFCLTLTDARDLERATALLDAVSQFFLQRSGAPMDLPVAAIPRDTRQS